MSTIEIDNLIVKSHIMKTLTSTEAKQWFWDMLQIIKSEPVKITKRNKDFAVLISLEEYNDLKALEVYEDLILWNLAMQSLDSWVYSAEDSENFFKDLKKEYLWK